MCVIRITFAWLCRQIASEVIVAAQGEIAVYPHVYASCSKVKQKNQRC
jgi:hypothetical protein